MLTVYQISPVGALFLSDQACGLDVIRQQSGERADEHSARFLAQAGRLNIVI